jgi:hypothetical protein
MEAIKNTECDRMAYWDEVLGLSLPIARGIEHPEQAQLRPRDGEEWKRWKAFVHNLEEPVRASQGNAKRKFTYL